MNILIPGADPPMLTPYCWYCQLPAERIVFDVVSSPYNIGVHAQCCGKTSSSRMAIETFMEMRATGKKYYAITPKRSLPGLRPLPRSELSYLRAVK